METSNKQDILNWLNQIEPSGLSVKEFFEKNNVPFSERQYYRYKAKIRSDGVKN